MLKSEQLCLADIVFFMKRIFRNALALHGFPEFIIFYQIIRTFSLFFFYYRVMIESNKGSKIGTQSWKGRWMKVRKEKDVVVEILLGICIVLIIVEGVIFYRNSLETYSNVPDLVSSFVSNNDYHLMVVANSKEITDKESFSKEVIEMCRNNSFKSMIFSTDLKGYPGSLDIDVYLQKEDIGKTDSVLNIRFQPDEWNSDYNIKDDVEHYRLYVDEEQIDL